MANIKEMYDWSIWFYCEENDYKTNIDEYNDEYANHDRVVIIKNHMYFEPKLHRYFCNIYIKNRIKNDAFFNDFRAKTEVFSNVHKNGQHFQGKKLFLNTREEDNKYPLAMLANIYY